MGLAETAQLLVKLTLKDETSGVAQKAKLSIGELGKTALLAGGAAGFGALTAGALQAESAQGKFMAATGKSREEAKKFVSDMDSLAGSAGAVGVSFDEIVDTGTQVAQQFQITGEKGRDLTEDILEFAKVTRQDASDAAAHLEDTLSAFGLEADDAAGFMDKLVLSNQKFGTEAGPETLSILQGMAPALQAMGEDLDSGIGLLNLFETAGLDAGAAQRGLQKAIQDLKPGQSLDDLIAQIGSIEDPTKRAQKAMEIFGTRSGVGLANAIRPGLTSLDDFQVTMGEAEGTTRDAAEAMLTTTDRIKGLFDKLGAGARELGQQFGPLITGVASLGTLLGPALAKALSTAQASGVWKAAAASLGTAMGGTISGGIIAGLSGAGIAGALQSALTDIDVPLPGGFDLFPSWEQNIKDHAAAAATGSGQAFQESLKQFGPFAVPEDFVGPLQPGFYRIGTEAGEATGEGVADGVHDSYPTVQQQIAGLVASERFENDAAYQGRVLGLTFTGSLGDAIRDSKGDARDAWDDYIYALEHPKKRLKDIAWIEGKLSSERLQEGLHSQDPRIRADAENTQTYLIGLWENLKGTTYNKATATSSNLQDGLNDNYAGAKSDARGFVSDFNALLSQLKNNYNVNVGIHTYHEGGTGPGGRGTGSRKGGGPSDTGGVDTRALGGPVAPNTMYEVTEGGIPEMLSVGDRSYLLMGARGGRIDPIRSPAAGYAGGGAQMPPVIVNVLITARDIENAQGHRRILQGTTGRFG